MSNIDQRCGETQTLVQHLLSKQEGSTSERGLLTSEFAPSGSWEVGGGRERCRERRKRRQVLVQLPSIRLLKHVVRCYLRLCDSAIAKEVLKSQS